MNKEELFKLWNPGNELLRDAPVLLVSDVEKFMISTVSKLEDIESLININSLYDIGDIPTAYANICDLLKDLKKGVVIDECC